MGSYGGSRGGGSADHILLPIQQSDATWVRLIKEKMEKMSLQRSIFRIGNNEKASSVPKLISIGPYHYANESLRAMEEHKWKYSFALLARKPNLEARLNECIKGLKELEHRASICYAHQLNLTSQTFMEIMLIDGCFIIELFIRHGVKSFRGRQGDPFFGRTGSISALRHDMMMLENQIPFFVLQMLFSLAPIPAECTLSLNQLAFRFFKAIIPGDNVVFQDNFSLSGHHFLDMIRGHLLPVCPKMVLKSIESSSEMIKSATYLEHSGILLKENTKEYVNLLDMEFAKGVLAIPRLKIQQNTEALLRNLIGFEQCCSSVGNASPYITSYAFLMQNLMCSEKDVELLEKKGIVRNYTADRRAVVDMFTRACSGIDLKQSLYAELCEHVNGYKRKPWFQRRSLFKGKLPLI